MQFYGPTNDEPLIFKHPQDRDRIQLELLLDDDYRAWSSKFDFHFLERAGYRLPPPERWHDGRIYAHLIDEVSSTALQARDEALHGAEVREPEKALRAWLNAEARRRRKAAKDAGEEFVQPNYSDVPDEIMYPYAATDVIATRRVCDAYEPMLGPELRELYELERGVMVALYDAERRGIPVDAAGAARFESALIERVEELETRAIELAGKSDFNLNSSKQLHEALKRRGADLTFVTNESMDAENLATVDDELASVALAFRSEYKNFSTYVRPLLHESIDTYTRSTKAPFIHEGRIHPSFNQIGPRTGRMSCSDPNVQNWPRDDLRLRYLLRAEPGHKLVTCDLDAIEWRLFAAYAGGTILDSVKAGEDPHSATAQRVGLTDFKREAGVETARQRGKRLNYLIIFGGGNRAIRKNFRVNMDGARDISNRLHAAYPEIHDLQARIQYRLEDRGYLKTPWGRRHRIAPRLAYKGVNFLIQGTAADLLKASLVQLHQAGVPVVAAVHDELIAHVPDKDADEAAILMEKCMIEHPRITDKVPLSAEAKIVDRWSEAKDPDFRPPYLQGQGVRSPA